MLGCGLWEGRCAKLAHQNPCQDFIIPATGVARALVRRAALRMTRKAPPGCRSARIRRFRAAMLPSLTDRSFGTLITPLSLPYLRARGVWRGRRENRCGILLEFRPRTKVCGSRSWYVMQQALCRRSTYTCVPPLLDFLNHSLSSLPLYIDFSSIPYFHLWFRSRLPFQDAYPSDANI